MSLLPRKAGRAVVAKPGVDIAIWGASIRPHMWMSLYNQLKETNKCSFKIFFCGHEKPNFELPQNFIYIYSDIRSAPPCAEIARRYAMNEQSEFISQFVDDYELSDGVLDALIEEIKSYKGEGELVTGISFRPTLLSQHCRAPLCPKGFLNSDKFAGNDDGKKGIHIQLPTMKRKVATIWDGGIDKRFNHMQWVEELLLRLHVTGVSFRTCPNAVGAEDISKQGPNAMRMSRRGGKTDIRTLHSLWSWYPVRRKTPGAEYYSKEDLKLSVDLNFK